MIWLNIAILIVYNGMNKKHYMSQAYVYPTKKETHHYDFPIKISF